MAGPDWVPDGVDTHRPSIARVYDYLLDGSHNFRADREAAQQALAALPNGRRVAYANRDFLRRAVSFCVEQGVTQFLDIGSGIPTVGNVHEVAQGVEPHARVVYVDIDPVAVAHSRAILAGNGLTGVLRADARDPEGILADPVVTNLLDLAEPVALLMVTLLHFVPDADDPHGIVARFKDRLAPGSLLVISHGTADDVAHGGQYDKFVGALATNVAQSYVRPKAEVARFFDGFDLIEPGVEWITRWRPDEGADASETHHIYGGVARKPCADRVGGDRW